MRWLILLCLATTLAMAAPNRASAQQPACKGAPGPSMAMGEQSATPPEKLPQPVAMSGIGNGTIEISTTSPDARLWFNQGLNLFHDFWDYESSKAFEQSVRLDPGCAMCYWGLYESEAFRGENDDWAEAALKQAQRLGKHSSPAEKLYIKAAAEAQKDRWKEKRAAARRAPAANGKGWSIGGEAELSHVDSKETKTLRKLVALKPEDTQAKIFLAESLIDGFDKHDRPKPGTAEAQTILAGILAAHPDDSAANHYWIHAQEAGLHPEAALDAARKLGALTPASGHMVHMPGHIFYRVGDYETARISFLNSMNTDADYMRSQHVGVDDDWNYVHNLMYLIADLLEAGRLEEATAASASLTAARGGRATTLYRFSTRDGMTRLDPLLPVALRSADWAHATRLLEASTVDPALVNLSGLRESLLFYTRGVAALTAGDIALAEAQSKALDTSLKAKPAEPPMKPMGGGSKDAMATPIHSFLDVAALELRASLLMAQGKAADADDTFGKAADAEKALGYHEPPIYIRPVAESRGDALLRAKRFANARTAYEAALKERPNSGFALYGIAQADAASGDKTAATADFQRLMDAWKNADPTLPQLNAARSWVQSQGTLAER